MLIKDPKSWGNKVIILGIARDIPEEVWFYHRGSYAFKSNGEIHEGHPKDLESVLVLHDTGSEVSQSRHLLVIVGESLELVPIADLGNGTIIKVGDRFLRLSTQGAQQIRRPRRSVQVIEFYKSGNAWLLA